MMDTPHDASTATTVVVVPPSSLARGDTAGAQDGVSLLLQPHEIAALHALFTAPQHLDDDGILVFAKNPALRAALPAEEQAVLWEAVARLCEAHAHMVYESGYDGSF